MLGLTTYGEDNFDQYKKFDLIGDDYQTSLLEALFKDPETFAKIGEELKTAFRNFKGILLNYKNSKLVVKHNGLTDDFVEPVVDWPSKELNFTNSFEISNDEVYDKTEYTENENDYTEDESIDEDIEDIDDSLTNSDEFYINSNGPLADNIEILKEIATIKGYTLEECNNFTTQYVDWITEDPKQLVYHDETLRMGIKCWKYIEYLPHLKEFAHFVIPLMGIIASDASCERAFWQQRRILGDQATKTSIELEKAKMFFAFND